MILAFFGYNESFGDLGRSSSRTSPQFITHTLGQKYNGQGPPRLVLFSPIAHEDLNDRSLPDGKANNARLESYTAAMAEVARPTGAVRRPLPPDAELYARRHEAATRSTAST